MTTRKKYSKEFKLDAVVAAFDAGYALALYSHALHRGKQKCQRCQQSEVALCHILKRAVPNGAKLSASSMRFTAVRRFHHFMP
jgi:hypothetical protein